MYIQHFLKNLLVSLHAFRDFIAHIIHGLFPGIKIKHHEGVNERGDY